MTTVTPEDAIRAASSIARDVAEGRLTPAALEDQLETELRALVANVVGEGDPAWPVQCDVARQVIAHGGIPLSELQEWVAVQLRRERPDGVEPGQTPPEPVSLPTVATSLDNDVADDIPAPETEALAEVVEPAPPVAVPPRQADTSGYDPLRGWEPVRTRR